ncbi:MAG: glutamine--fructose-6-phosphate transaminase (isomerizing) [Bacilli bacterium]|jgi:glucosamine--fructose-6-phosphate aminotransferase (isomerizing)
MCGIIGYLGPKNSIQVLLNGLSKLEYKDYDSSGLAFFKDGKIKVIKSSGTLKRLKFLTRNIKVNIGIGHLRWATHGKPVTINAHPHLSQNKKIAIVHNGIIENEKELKEELIKEGFSFKSETDTEVIANLLEYNDNNDFLLAIKKTSNKLKGSYALAILHEDYPETIFALRNDSPLIIGLKPKELYLTSDIPAITDYTKEVYYLSNKEIAVLKTAGNINFYDFNLKEINKYLSKITWNNDAAQKQGFKHFMLKEIYEQPKVISSIINQNIKEDLPYFDLKLNKDLLQKINKIYVVACGTSYYASLNFKNLGENLLGINTEINIASEFKYSNPLVDNNSLVIVLSQSGETADTLGALRLAKEKKAHTLAIVNVIASTIAQEADDVIYTRAGPEIAVASTKNYSAQLIIIYLLIIKMGLLLNKIEKEKAKDLTKELKEIPKKIEKIFELGPLLKDIAKKYYRLKNIYFIGRLNDYYTALEGALKLKEISYIHAEAYPAGELKHGTMALIDKNTLVIGIITNNIIFEKTLNNLQEISLKEAKTIIISNKNIKTNKENIIIPCLNPLFSPILTIIPLQLLAYYIADYLKRDIDKPKNLAKSVTIE